MEDLNRGARAAAGKGLPALPASGAGAFSLIEIMVTVALLSLIILGLLSMFNQVQRAFRSSMTQVDVLEAGRAVTDLMVRDMEGIYPTQIGYNTNTTTTPWATNFFALSSSNSPLLQYLAGTSGANGPYRTNSIQTVFFMTRVNQSYVGNGYFVYPDSPEGSVGTLYRYQFATNKANAARLSGYFAQSLAYIMQNGPTNTPNFINRIADGVVAFNVRPYDTNGVEVTATVANWDGLMHVAIPIRDFNLNFYTNVPIPNAYAQILPDNRLNYYYLSNAVPASLALEVAFIEPRILARYKGMGGPPPIDPILQGAQRSYLSNHVSEVHLFRQRISVRNVDFTAYK